MSCPLALELKAEIKKAQQRIGEQRRVIKRSKGNAVVLEAAQADIREMQTHLGVLEGNLAKTDLSSAGGADAVISVGGS